MIRVPFRQILVQTLTNALVIGGVATLVYFGSRWYSKRVEQSRSRRPMLTALVLLFPVFASLSMYGIVRASLPERERERDPNKRQIKLNPGFQWSIYAQGTMDNPTAISFSPDGNLYIADIAGTLWVAKDTNHDYVVDSITPWADGFNLLVCII